MTSGPLAHDVLGKRNLGVRWPVRVIGDYVNAVYAGSNGVGDWLDRVRLLMLVSF